MSSNLNRWQRGLIALISNLNQQVENLEADQKEDMDRYLSMGKPGEILLSQSVEHYSSKITKIKRFKFHVEKRLDEVTIMIESGGNSNLSYAEFLKAAIIKHKELMESMEMEPTEIDKALWAAVDNSWQFDSIGTTAYAS